MKLSKTSLMELSHKYSSILRKCAYLNAMAVMGIAFGANAADYQGGITISENTLYQDQSLSNVDFTQASVTSRSGNKSFGGYAFVDRPYTLTVKDSEYSGLTFDGSGTVFSTRIPLATDIASLNVSGTTFQNNHTVYDGGAIANYGNLTITDTTFSGNTADYTGSEYDTPVSDSNPIGGGAIALGSSSTSSINSSITNTTFENNRSGTNGGAIGTRLGSSGDNHAATLDVDAIFTGNKANGNGGAIYNTFYANNGLGKGDGVTVKGTFTSNEAKNGGAIYNDGAKDKAGNDGGVIAINDTTFTDNVASVNGGAIYNDAGDVSVVGSSFAGNTAATEGGAIFAAGQYSVDNGTTMANVLIKDSIFTDNEVTGAERWGGAITAGRNSKITISGSTFTGNTADYSGAIMTYSASPAKNSVGGILDITNTTFDSNTAKGTGAVSVMSEASIKNSVFTNNTATTDTDGAGALFVGALGKVTIDNTRFEGNKAEEYRGGAISTRSADLGNNENARLDILNSTFKGNTAGTTGGAFDNYLYSSSADVTAAYLKGSTFISNIADKGGAIYNHGATDRGGNVASLKIENSTFTTNVATTLGGAIYNEANGGMTFAGTNIFSGNKANGVLNDIYNDGTLNVSGNLTLDGGIAGDGVLNFQADSSLTASLGTTSIVADIVTFGDNNTLTFFLPNNQANENVNFITANDVQIGDNLEITDNALYNLELIQTGDDMGKIAVSVKSGSELLEGTSASAQEADTISAVANTAGNGTAAGNAIAEGISTAMQTGHSAAAVKAAKDLAPTTSQTIVGVAQGVNSILSNVAGGRMATVGRASGDTFVGGALWAQGLYNHTKQDSSSSTDGFSADTKGISFGIDGKITENLMIGLGYGYTDTDADAGSHGIDVEGHNFFVYSEYKPNNWYINGMFTYGLSKYDEQKSPMGVSVKAKYDVDTYAANLMTGYDFANGLTPEVGLRYLLTDQESYNDGVQHVKAEDSDLLTGVAAIKYHQTYKAKDWTFKPNLRLGATYDMISDNSKSAINVIGGSSYNITGERLERFGVETGIGVEATVKDWNFSLDYNGGFRKDYQSHTGMLKAKYNF